MTRIIQNTHRTTNGRIKFLESKGKFAVAGLICDEEFEKIKLHSCLNTYFNALRNMVDRLIG